MLCACVCVLRIHVRAPLEGSDYFPLHCPLLWQHSTCRAQEGHARHFARFIETQRHHNETQRLTRRLDAVTRDAETRIATLLRHDPDAADAAK